LPWTARIESKAVSFLEQLSIERFRFRYILFEDAPKQGSEIGQAFRFLTSPGETVAGMVLSRYKALTAIPIDEGEKRRYLGFGDIASITLKGCGEDVCVDAVMRDNSRHQGKVVFQVDTERSLLLHNGRKEKIVPLDGKAEVGLRFNLESLSK